MAHPPPTWSMAREYILNGFGGSPGEDGSVLGDAIIAFALPKSSE
jgi:hypothetical protein